MGYVFGCRHTGSRLARHLQGRCLGLSQPGGFRALLIPPHFSISVLWTGTVLLISWDRIGLESQDFAHLFNEQ